MRIRIVIICGIILAVCMWLMLHRPVEQQKPRSREADVASTNQLNQSGQSKVAEHSKSLSPPIPPTLTNVQVHHTASEASNIVQQQLLTMWQSPIEFYGKVVDENTNPLTGARVQFGWAETPTKEGEHTATTESDAGGLFSLQDKRGPTLEVWVSKEGYYASQGGHMGFHYGFLSPGKFSPDPDNPVVFHLRKKGQGAVLITSQNGIRPDLTPRVPTDGHPIMVDLLQREIGPSGDLEISQVKPDYSHWQQATQWSFHMNIPSGGFIGQNDEFPFAAPASGYQSTVDLNFVKGEPDWTTHFVTNYYIVFGQPPKYGWLRVEGDIAQETVFLKYAINPTGSQNLEPQ